METHGTVAVIGPASMRLHTVEATTTARGNRMALLRDTDYGRHWIYEGPELGVGDEWWVNQSDLTPAESLGATPWDASLSIYNMTKDDEFAEAVKSALEDAQKRERPVRHRLGKILERAHLPYVSGSLFIIWAAGLLGGVLAVNSSNPFF